MSLMVQAQIQLDERTTRRFGGGPSKKGKSMSAVAHEELASALDVRQRTKRYSALDFPWIGAGSSRKDPHNPAENRDGEYAAAIEEHGRPRRR